MAAGDHLFFYNAGYSHHGIDCGDGRVIHFESDPWLKLTGHWRPHCRPTIREISLTQFSAGRPFRVRVYQDADAPETVVARAQSRLGDSGYRLFDNNCEHFAVWCKTGEHTSTQVTAFVEAARHIGKDLLKTATLAQHVRRLPTHYRPWGYGAAMALTAGSFAVRYARVRWTNYSRGES